jgi:hypothetical protein
MEIRKHGLLKGSEQGGTQTFSLVTVIVSDPLRVEEEAPTPALIRSAFASTPFVVFLSTMAGVDTVAEKGEEDGFPFPLLESGPLDIFGSLFSRMSAPADDGFFSACRFI